MTTKGLWIADFEKLLLTNEPDINNNNPDYSYQITTAYFYYDAHLNTPAYKVEQAYQRYLEAKQ